jgi:F0F1-type ATP synthase epsilon subunit
MSNKKLLSVEVRSRQGVVYEGELYAVTSYNQVGVFDILPEHSNFVSMISKKVILRRVDGRNEEINLEKGVIMVQRNNVKVFLGVGKI